MLAEFFTEAFLPAFLLTLIGLLPPSGRLGAAEDKYFSIAIFVYACTQRVTVYLVSCRSWGITFQGKDLTSLPNAAAPLPGVREFWGKVSPNCLPGQAATILLWHHIGKYLIFSKNLLFLKTGRNFCLQLLQHAMRTNVSCWRNLCYLCVCSSWIEGRCYRKIGN